MGTMRKNVTPGVLGLAAAAEAARAAEAGRYRLPEPMDVVASTGAASPSAEQFRRLATYLADPALAPTQVIAVTSPVPGDGKSFVSLNLALAFAREGAGETLVIDADLRRPGLSNPLQPQPRAGLDLVLQDKVAPEAAIVRLENYPISMLPSGRHTDDPLRALTSDRFGAVIARLRERYGRIIIDTPPVVPFSDAVLMAGHADGVLVVVRANNTPKALYEEALEILENTRVLGVTLNGAVRSLIDMNRDYEYYHRTYYARAIEKP